MSVKITTLIVFFLLFENDLIFSQTILKDKIHNQKISQYTDGDNDSLLFYADKLLLSKDSCLVHLGTNMRAKAYYQKGNDELAKKITLNLFNGIKDINIYCYNKSKITALNRLFWIYKNENKYQKLFETLLKKEEIVNNLRVKDNYYYANKLGVASNFASIKSILGLHKESREIQKKILLELPAIYKDLDKGDYYLKLYQSATLNSIGDSHLNSSQNNLSADLDSASLYFKRAYEVAKKFSPIHKNSETFYQLREAEVLVAKMEFKKALLVINAFNDNAIKYNTKQKINSLKAICFYQLKKKDSTFFYSNLFLENYVKSSNSKKRLPIIYDILANQYFESKQIDSAFKYSELSLVELNILNDLKNEVNKSHYLYDFKNAKRLNALITKKSEKYRRSFILILIAVFFMGLVIMYLMYNKNKKNVTDFHKIRDKIKKKLPKIRKDHAINKNLEKEFIRGFEELKKTKEFLKSGFNIHLFAKKLNTNTTYLSQTVNKVYKQSFKQFVIELRIEYLLNKLNEEKKFRKYTIKAMAEEIGYTNASAFTRAFKKYKGITPSEYLKILK